MPEIPQSVGSRAKCQPRTSKLVFRSENLEVYVSRGSGEVSPAVRSESGALKLIFIGDGQLEISDVWKVFVKK